MNWTIDLNIMVYFDSNNQKSKWNIYHEKRIRKTYGWIYSKNIPPSDNSTDDDMDYWKSIIDGTEGFGKVVYYNKEIVGFVVVEKWMGCIVSLYVKEEYRKKGIATQLIKCCEDTARRQGRRFISLDILSGNDKALALYKKLGFYDYKTTMIKNLY